MIQFEEPTTVVVAPSDSASVVVYDNMSNVITNSPSEASVINTSQYGSIVDTLYTTEFISHGQPGLPGKDGISEENMVYSRRTDFVGDSVIYRGEAQTGSAESAPVWRIRKITIGNDSDVTETWAGGTSSFDKVWSDRLTLSYI